MRRRVFKNVTTASFFFILLGPSSLATQNIFSFLILSNKLFSITLNLFNLEKFLDRYP